MEQSKIEEMARQERLEYFKKWRAANKDKVRATNQRYWEKRALKKAKQQPQPDTEPKKEDNA